MSLVTIAGMVRTHVTNALSDGGYSFPVLHDNVPEEGETDVDAVPTNERWGRLTMQFGLRQHADVGARYIHVIGVGLLQLFEPIGVGDGAQLEIVDVITTACDGITLVGPPAIAFRPPYVSAPPVRDGSHWLTVVSIPFRGDIHHE